MTTTFQHLNFTGSAEIDVESEKLYGKILYIHDLVSYEADTLPALRAAFENAVEHYKSTCAELEKTPLDGTTSTLSQWAEANDDIIYTLTDINSEKGMVPMVTAKASTGHADIDALTRLMQDAREKNAAGLANAGPFLSALKRNPYFSGFTPVVSISDGGEQAMSFASIPAFIEFLCDPEGADNDAGLYVQMSLSGHAGFLNNEHTCEPDKALMQKLDPDFKDTYSWRPLPLSTGEDIMRILQLLAKGEALFVGTLDDEDKQTLYPTHHIAQPPISLNGALWS